MRKVLGASIGVGVLLVAAGLGALLLRNPEPPPPAPAPTSTPQPTVVAPPVPKPEPEPEPKKALPIRGTVIGITGPVQGARVLATNGDGNPAPTCGALSRNLGFGDDRLFTQCMDEVAGAVLQRILAEEGADPGYEERVTGEDGTFEFQYDPQGDVTLWVFGPHGAAIHPNVRAVPEGLQLPLATGLYLEGQVVDERRRPLVGARVRAMSLSPTRFFDGQTTEGGRYRIGPLPRAEYLLAFTMEGQVPTLLDPARAHRRPVVLTAPRQVQGRVMSNGAPIANAEVLLTPLPDDKGDTWEATSPSQTQRTDARGRFHFDELSAHRFGLSVSHGDRHALEDIDLRGPRPAPEVTLKPGSALMVEGRVLGTEGALIGTATLTLQPSRGTPRRFTAHHGFEGRFQVGPVKPGTYHFTVSAPDHLDSHSAPRTLKPGQGPLDFTLEKAPVVSGVLVDEQGAPLPDISIQVSTTSGPVTTNEHGAFVTTVPSPGSVVLTNGPGEGVFAGQRLTVQAPASNLRWVLKQGARVRGKVLDEEGQPLEGVTVLAWREDDTRSARPSLPTNSNGLFQLTGLKPGRFVLEALVETEGTRRVASRAVDVGEGEPTQVELTLEAGASLSGLLVDDEGHPVHGARVCGRTIPEARPAWRRDAPSADLPSCVDSNAEGRFAWRHLPPGAVDVSVVQWGARLDAGRSTGGRQVNDALRVQVGASDLRLVVIPAGVVKGRVLGPDGAPLKEFQVLGEDLVSPQGTFVLPRDVLSRDPVRIAAPGMTTVTRDVVFREPSGVVNLGDVRMTPGLRVVGRVLDDATSEPLSEAVVIPASEPIPGALDRELHRPGATKTDSRGRFEFLQVDTSPRLLQVEADGHLRHQELLKTPPRQELVVRLTKASLVKLKVIDAKGEPGLAEVFFDREGDDLSRDPVRMGDARNGSQVELRPGTYRVQALGVGETPARFAPQRLQVPRGGTVDLTLRAVREGATLELDLKNQAPRSTYLLPLGGPFSPRMLDADFTLRSRALPQGPSSRGTSLVFDTLPPGKLTLLIVESGGRGYHVEELDIPAKGTVKHAVTPAWRPRVLPD
ncbi:carboxypeptidase regulatory-like domain-containing protein [Myxococcus sp. K15C18031901]|uniref:carboxypeptidase regulatory-like domain-containing protein n=1 Tax=Myxococcus dinghuensis TaxID=2906761 RepID=UPI0020A77B23|nr:carboxypeptidase regulatory-like domain-containing protein [Myxococcus dinghuensis]MCP3099314.1 carboxypeptidase regulatory-like domain-containing protein [Myxococcus dinghuensis]